MNFVKLENYNFKKKFMIYFKDIINILYNIIIIINR